MKYCPNCGNQLIDNAVVCVACGADVSVVQPSYQQNYQQPYQQNQPYGQDYQQNQPYQQNYQQPYGQPYQQPMYPQAPVVMPESSGTAIAAIIFAFLMPIVGLILGIVGLTKYKIPSNRTKCIAAIVISVIVWILGIVAFTAI